MVYSRPSISAAFARSPFSTACRIAVLLTTAPFILTGGIPTTSKSPPDGRGERRRKRRSPEKAVRVIARALELTAKVPLLILWSGAAHSRNLREREDSLRNFFARRLSDLIDRDRVRNIEPSGL